MAFFLESVMRRITGLLVRLSAASSLSFMGLMAHAAGDEVGETLPLTPNFRCRRIMTS